MCDYAITKGKNEEKQDIAKQAIDVYKSLSGNALMRAEFIKGFMDSGGKLSKETLKFTCNFSKQIDSKKGIEISSEETIYTRSQILQFKGLSVSDFDSYEQAFKMADKFIKQNEEDHGHEHFEDHNDDPMLSRFFYVKELGKKRTWSQTESRQLKGDCKDPKKAQLHDATNFLEAIGPDLSASSSSTTSNVKIEFLGYAEIVESANSLRNRVDCGVVQNGARVGVGRLG